MSIFVMNVLSRATTRRALLIQCLVAALIALLPFYLVGCGEGGGSSSSSGGGGGSSGIQPSTDSGVAGSQPQPALPDTSDLTSGASDVSDDGASVSDILADGGIVETPVQPGSGATQPGGVGQGAPTGDITGAPPAGQNDPPPHKSIPEPGTGLLLLTALSLAVAVRRRKSNSNRHA